MPALEDEVHEKTELELQAQASLRRKAAGRNGRRKMENSVVMRGPGVWEVLADERLERLIKMTNFDYIEAEERFFRVLHSSGLRFPSPRLALRLPRSALH